MSTLEIVHSDTGRPVVVTSPEPHAANAPGFSLLKRNGGTVPFEDRKSVV